MDYDVEFEIEDDGRWIAEIPAIPGVMAYGATKNEARENAEALAAATAGEASKHKSPRGATAQRVGDRPAPRLA